MSIDDKLPPEMLTHVLICLDVNDLLRCQLVNRRWKATIESNIRINRLAVRESEAEDEEWSVHLVFTSQLMESTHQFITRSRNFTQRKIMLTILKNLRKLSIDRLDSGLALCLEGLTNLEHLEIWDFFLDRIHKFKSTNLKALTVRVVTGPQRALWLDTPNLSTVEIGCQMRASSLQFIYPESVTRLAAYYYDEEFLQFKNLTVCFIFNCVEMPSDLLEMHPALRLLHCGRSSWSAASALLSSKSQLRRSDFKFYNCGLPIDTIEELGGYVDGEDDELLFDFTRSEHFHLILSSYSRRESLMPYNRLVNYTLLVRHFNGQIERGIFGWFTNIRKLVVSKPIGGRAQFVWFIRNCKWLHELIVKKCKLGQSICDRLPDYQPHLRELEFYKEPRLDFGFLLGFRKLRLFKTTQQVSLSFAARAIRQLDKLRIFDFKHKGKPVMVTTYDYQLLTSEGTRSFDSREGLVQQLESGLLISL